MTQQMVERLGTFEVRTRDWRYDVENVAYTGYDRPEGNNSPTLFGLYDANQAPLALISLDRLEYVRRVDVKPAEIESAVPEGIVPEGWSDAEAGPQEAEIVWEVGDEVPNTDFHLLPYGIRLRDGSGDIWEVRGDEVRWVHGAVADSRDWSEWIEEDDIINRSDFAFTVHSLPEQEGPKVSDYEVGDVIATPELLGQVAGRLRLKDVDGDAWEVRDGEARWCGDQDWRKYRHWDTMVSLRDSDSFIATQNAPFTVTEVGD